jgi:hypothetical protein
MHIVAFRESEIKDVIRVGLSFLMFLQASIMRFNCSALVLDFTAYTRDFIHPTEFGQVISVAKQPEYASHTNGFENVD